MDKMLKFLKNLSEGDLYKINVPCYDDEIVVYIHVNNLGKVSSIYNSEKINAVSLINEEIKRIKNYVFHLNQTLIEIENQIQILENIISSSDHNILLRFFEIKDFSDKAFKQLQNDLTHPNLVVRILSEYRESGERSYDWRTNDVYVKGVGVLYETCYNIFDDLERRKKEKIKIEIEINNLTRLIN